MKLRAYEVPKFLKAPDPNINTILVYGNDIGIISETTKHFVQNKLGKEYNETQFITLTTDILSEDPTRLYDEAATISMFGECKVIMLEMVTDKEKNTLVSYLDTPCKNSFLILTAGSLAPTNAIRKLIETCPHAMALPCYEDDIQNSQNIIRTHLQEEGFNIEPDALHLFSETISTNRALIRQELNRLVLFMGPRGSTERGSKETVMITREDIKKIRGDNDDVHIFDFIDYVVLGNVREADLKINKIKQSKNYQLSSAFGQLRRHFQMLHLTQLHIQEGMNQEQALKTAFRPPLHFKRQDKVKRQLRNWSLNKIETALNIINDTEVLTRQSPMSSEAQISYNLLRITRATKR